MKRVFRNAEETIHTFAQQSQEEGRSSNVFFYGKICYSYGYHFPLAIFTENAKGEKCVLLNGRKYSNTTARHQDITQAATRQYRQIVSFGLDRYSGADQDGHRRNESHYILEFRGIAEKLAVARKPAIYIEQARSLNDQAFEYFNFFGLTPSEEYQKAYTEATEVNEEVKARVKAQHAEILRRKKEREEEERKELAVKIQEWINGERQSLYPRPQIDILRVVRRSGKGWENARTANPGENFDFVETSQGVKMTIEEAKAIYLRLIRKELKAGDQVLTGYTVSKVNGTVKIGCHTFDTAYLLKFGEELTGINPAIVEMMEEFKDIKNS